MRPSEKTWGSMYAIGRLEVEEDGTANMEIINQTILEYNLAEGWYFITLLLFESLWRYGANKIAVFFIPSHFLSTV